MTCRSCGGFLESPAGRLFGDDCCAACTARMSMAFLKKRAAAQREAKAEIAREESEDQTWLDWVVVERVAYGALDPGRRLTHAEWFEVLARVGWLEDAELARRGGTTERTIRRMRKRWSNR